MSGQENDKWLQEARAEQERNGTVGSFTKEAHRAGFGSPIEYARQVVNSPHADAHLKKQAQFCLNANK
jgi:hypothetical protein